MSVAKPSKVGRVVPNAPWPVVPLASLLRDPLRNGHSAKSTGTPHGVRTLTLTAVTRGDFSERNTKITSANPDRVSDLWLEPGDILIERSNAPELVGTTRLYRGPKHFAIFPDLIIRARLNATADPSFVELVLQSETLREYFKGRAKGMSGSMPKIDQQTISEAPIPLPPLPEQRRIVAEIEKQFTRLDAGVAALRRTQANLKRYRAAVIDAALAVDWPTQPLIEIGEVVTGTTPSPKNQENYGGYLPFFTPTDLNAGYRLERAAQHLSSVGAASARPLPAQTVLVTCIGATIGKTALARVPSATNQQINAFIPHDTAVLPEWAFWMFTSPRGQKQIRENASATTMPILNKSRFGKLTMPVPPLATQRKLIAEIERKLTIADTLGHAVTQATKRADLLKRSILSAAFDGRFSD